VVGLIVVSTAARFAAAQAFSTPWIAPDEMVYGMLGEGLWSHGSLTLRSFPSPYYSLLTPALIGAPLAWLDLADGIQWARLLQALAMSLVAVPTYLWARRVASAWWAVAAAALVLVSPLLHYAGFLMTEPLTLTVVTVALLMLARALEEPSMWRYGVFVGWATAAAAVRLQALVLLPAFLLACRRRLGRGTRSQRACGRSSGSLRFAAAAAVLGRRRRGRRGRGALDPAASRRVHADRRGDGRRCRAAARGRVARVRCLRPRPRRHAARIGCPRVDGAVPPRHGSRPARLRLDRARLHGAPRRPGRALRRRLRGHDRRALPAHRLAAARRRALRVDLARRTAGAPVVLPLWGLVVVGAATVPIAQLATPETLPNAPTAAGLMRLGSEGWARAALVIAALVAGALVLALPRRFAWVTAAVVGVGLALLSVDAGDRIAAASAHEERVRSDPSSRPGSTRQVSTTRPCS
jgi:hypothetical protein